MLYLLNNNQINFLSLILTTLIIGIISIFIYYDHDFFFLFSFTLSRIRTEPLVEMSLKKTFNLPLY